MEQEENRGPQDPGSGQGESASSLPPDASGNDAGHGTEKIISGAENTGPTVVKQQNTLLNRAPAVHVKLPVYDGPLDLLLELIKKNEMDIYNIPISVITQQYLESLDRMKQLNLDIAGDYLVMAATLLYIKSKMLLPQDNTEEEDEGIDPREELVRKLLEYQAFKAAAKELGFLEDERGKVFTRKIADYYLSSLEPEDVGIDTFSADLFDLLSAFQTVLSKVSREAVHEVFEQVISIEEKISEIRRRLVEENEIRFSDLFKNHCSRNLLIATFLAILEIVKSKFARIFQDQHFGEIMIQKRTEQNQAA